MLRRKLHVWSRDSFFSQSLVNPDDHVVSRWNATCVRFGVFSAESTYNMRVRSAHPILYISSQCQFKSQSMVPVWVKGVLQIGFHLHTPLGIIWEQRIASHVQARARPAHITAYLLHHMTYHIYCGEGPNTHHSAGCSAPIP